MSSELRGFLGVASPTDAARRLLGCELVAGGCRVRIVETEAYAGDGDPGSHASRGMTPRTRVMFGEAGRAYVYFTYGMHWCLNVVTGPVGKASAVLLRAAMPLEGLDEMRLRRPKARRDFELLSGPSRLCMALGIDGKHNDRDMFDTSESLQLQAREPIQDVLVGTRIGLAPGKGEHLPWRFVAAERAEWTSKPTIRG